MFFIEGEAGHAGNLVFGTINDTKIMALQGRFHYYEGFYQDPDFMFQARMFIYLLSMLMDVPSRFTTSPLSNFCNILYTTLPKKSSYWC